MTPEYRSLQAIWNPTMHKPLLLNNLVAGGTTSNSVSVKLDDFNSNWVTGTMWYMNSALKTTVTGTTTTVTGLTFNEPIRFMLSLKCCWKFFVFK
jgi:hypothetical protein